ncbi:hypothetical protein EAE99_008006 [Botrytis elliptica]|nr:hypothetical protein EAE99_008006 [Botrytis elliptica]
MPRLQTKAQNNLYREDTYSPGTAIYISLAAVYSTTSRTHPANQETNIIEARPHVSPPSQMMSPDPRLQPQNTHHGSRAQLNANSYHKGQSSSSNRQVNDQGSSTPHQPPRENLNRGYKPAKIGSSERQNRERDEQREPRSLAGEPTPKDYN